MKAGWRTVARGDLCDVVNGGTPKPNTPVVPAQAGTQDSATLDSRIRGNDEVEGA
jgi:hypothetical protein